ncbi:hypothetical protein JW968_04230 [Candidatus Woesearchaeota archaeon]|nr:hypothetical protein [Candidatus Woesearchaeota archaeon]
MRNLLISIMLIFGFIVVYSNPGAGPITGKAISMNSLTNVKYVMGHDADPVYKLKKHGMEDNTRWQNWMEEQDRIRFERKVREKNWDKKKAEFCSEFDADCSLFYDPKRGEWREWAYDPDIDGPDGD